MADSRARHCHETLQQDADGIGKKMYELFFFGVAWENWFHGNLCEVRKV